MVCYGARAWLYVCVGGVGATGAEQDERTSIQYRIRTLGSSQFLTFLERVLTALSAFIQRATLTHNAIAVACGAPADSLIALAVHSPASSLSEREATRSSASAGEDSEAADENASHSRGGGEESTAPPPPPPPERMEVPAFQVEEARRCIADSLDILSSIVKRVHERVQRFVSVRAAVHAKTVLSDLALMRQRVLRFADKTESLSADGLLRGELNNQVPSPRFSWWAVWVTALSA